MSRLAEEFGVSVRTVQRDIFELGFTMPLDIKTGRYDGGVYVVGDYTMDRMYMSHDEISLLRKIKEVADRAEKLTLDDGEKKMLYLLIQNYEKTSA